jgi:TetR/AcrR family transcriptional regulator, cholesterol catabolism regulator
MVKKQIDAQGVGLDRETWRHILKAAEELFLAKGYKGVTMKDLADVVQVTPAALYYHFPQGKEDLFGSMMQAMLEEWNTGLYQTIENAHGLRERLNVLTSYLLMLPVDRIPVLMRDAKEQLKDLTKHEAIFIQLREGFDQHITSVFQQAIDAGEIAPAIPAKILAAMYQGMVISLHMRFFAAKDKDIVERVDAPQLIAMLVTVLLNGVQGAKQYR